MTTVPWISQIGNTTANDCGPACALMVALSVGKGAGQTVESLSAKYDVAQDGTTAGDLTRMLRDMGCTPADVAGSIYPHIALIAYALLPARYDAHYTGLHWIVRLDDTHYHDPLWPDAARGANKLAPKSTLDQATRRIGVLDKPISAGQSGVVASDAPYLNVRRNPITTAPIICRLKNGAAVDITGTATDAQGRPWYVVSVPAVGAYRDEALTQSWPVELGYAAGWLIRPNDATPAPTPTPTPTPTPAPSKVLIGVNILGNHRVLADQYGAAGCRYFQVLDNFGVAAQLADRYPDAIVVHRHYVPWHMGGADLAAHMLAGELHPRVIYETLNEADNGQGDGDVRQLNDRLDAELSAAAQVRARGYRVSLGAYSMGTPDLWNMEIIDVFKRRVAGLYNTDAGIYIGFHLYTRKIGQDFDVWYARRWARLFEACGFDPALRKVLCSETGVDEGGVGGFPAHGYSPDQFAQWCRDWLACEAQPCAGQPSQILGGALFQVGNSSGWAGYNVEGYMPKMAEFWK